MLPMCCQCVANVMQQVLDTRRRADREKARTRSELETVRNRSLPAASAGSETRQEGGGGRSGAKPGGIGGVGVGEGGTDLAEQVQDMNMTQLAKARRRLVFALPYTINPEPALGFRPAAHVAGSSQLSSSSSPHSIPSSSRTLLPSFARAPAFLFASGCVCAHICVRASERTSINPWAICYRCGSMSIRSLPRRTV